MSPRFTIYDVANAGICDTKHFTDGLSGFSRSNGANLNDLALRQFCVPVSFSNWLISSLLSFLVENIVLIGANKQMLWIYARWVVASMKNMQPFWSWSVVNEPRNTMRGSRLSHYSKTPIPLARFCSNPVPAIIRFGNFVPKVLSLPTGKVDLWRCFHQRLGSIIHSLIVNRVSGFSELHTSTIRAFIFA